MRPPETLEEYLKRAFDPDNPKLSIKPRKYTDEADRSLIVVDNESVFVERTGEFHDKSFLPSLLKNEPSSFIVTHSSGELCRWLHTLLSEDPLWQFRVTPIEREIVTRKGKTLVVSDSIVHFLGFKRPNGHSESKYHYPLDPRILSRTTANQLYPQAQTSHEALLRFGQAVRNFLVQNQMKISASSGGMAGQLLRDKRFYPEDRRKVPRATNEKARPQLPGNFYRIYSKRKHFKSAFYLDQSSAHHRIASEIDLPDANVYARGYYHSDKNVIWCRAGSKRFEREISRYGLFKLSVTIPPSARFQHSPRYCDKPGDQVIYVYSNELDFLAGLGVHIRGIVASWTSNTIDYGIRAYANWALSINHRVDIQDRKTIKPILLSAYGVLASKPRILKYGFAKSVKGETKEITLGGLPVSMQVTETKKPGGDKLAHVIQRGMIEAETRNRSLQLATYLKETAKAKIIMVYADSVIVECNQLPFLPDTWKVQTALTALEIFNEVSFTSLELTKLPGIPFSDERDQMLLLERISPVRRKLIPT